MMRVFCLMMLIPALVHGQQPRPVPGPVPPFEPPHVHEITVNGMRVSLVPYGTTPTARVEVVFRSGRATEAMEETGIAQIVADYLLEGTRARSGTAVARELATIGTVGGALSVNVGTHETVIAAEVLAESAPRLVQIVAEVVLSPAFDSSALERLKLGVRRRSQLTTAPSIAMARAHALLFPHYAADRIPSDDGLGRLSVADVRGFHAREYVGAKAHVYVAGVFDRNAVESSIRSAFRAIELGSLAVRTSEDSVGALWSDTIPVVHLIDRPGATQTRIHIAYPIVDQMHPDHLLLNQMNAVMGSVQTSRIIANIRERRGFSYNISTQMVRRPGATSWTVQGDVNRDVTGDALREILGEIDRMRTEPPSTTELSEFQRFMSGGNIAEMATSRGIVDYLRFLDLYGVDRSYLRTLIPNIRAVTPADIRRAHATYIRPEGRAIVLVGDAARIESQLSGWTRVVR